MSWSGKGNFVSQYHMLLCFLIKFVQQGGYKDWIWKTALEELGAWVATGSGWTIDQVGFQVRTLESNPLSSGSGLRRHTSGHLGRMYGVARAKDCMPGIIGHTTTKKDPTSMMPTMLRKPGARESLMMLTATLLWGWQRTKWSGAWRGSKTRVRRRRSGRSSGSRWTIFFFFNFFWLS